MSDIDELELEALMWDGERPVVGEEDGEEDGEDGEVEAMPWPPSSFAMTYDQLQDAFSNALVDATLLTVDEACWKESVEHHKQIWETAKHWNGISTEDQVLFEKEILKLLAIHHPCQIKKGKDHLERVMKYTYNFPGGKKQMYEYMINRLFRAEEKGMLLKMDPRSLPWVKEGYDDYGVPITRKRNPRQGPY
mgnify:CR=1 FL=1